MTFQRIIQEFSFHQMTLTISKTIDQVLSDRGLWWSRFHLQRVDLTLSYYAKYH